MSRETIKIVKIIHKKECGCCFFIKQGKIKKSTLIAEKDIIDINFTLEEYKCEEHSTDLIKIDYEITDQITENKI